MVMKVIDVIEGEIYQVETDHDFLGLYRQIKLPKCKKPSWEHLINERESLWIPVSESTASNLEEALEEWVRLKKKKE